MSEPERLTLGKGMREIPLREDDRPETRDPWTPGPWRVSGCRQRTKQGTDDYLIEHGNAETFSPGLAQVMSDGGRLPVQGNARLIKADPPDPWPVCNCCGVPLALSEAVFDPNEYPGGICEACEEAGCKGGGDEES